MNPEHYQFQELTTLLSDLQSQKVSGTLYLDAEINPTRKQRSRVLLWKNGQIVYGGSTVANNQDFPKMLVRKLNREWSDTAINFAMQKTTDQISLNELLELLVRMRLFTWEQIETVVYTQVVLTLKQMLPHAGKFQFDSTAQFDLGVGWDWVKLMSDITQHQEEWSVLVPLIPSMEVVPQLQTNALNMITDPAVHQHLQKWVDGQRSLVDIAEGLDKDPLKVAKSYQHWVQAGWVVFESNIPRQKSNLPTILTVDDSPVVQTLIKRALAGYCQVLAVSNAPDALNLVCDEKISLLLLDVSMPGVDGLELCRILRSIPKFRSLPIIMLTARDGLFDKVKGQMAGSTEYLTKPFDAEKLHQVVGKYLNLGVSQGLEEKDKTLATKEVSSP